MGSGEDSPDVLFTGRYALTYVAADEVPQSESAVTTQVRLPPKRVPLRGQTASPRMPRRHCRSATDKLWRSWDTRRIRVVQDLGTMTDVETPAVSLATSPQMTYLDGRFQAGPNETRLELPTR